MTYDPMRIKGTRYYRKPIKSITNLLGPTTMISMFTNLNRRFFKGALFVAVLSFTSFLHGYNCRYGTNFDFAVVTAELVSLDKRSTYGNMAYSASGTTYLNSIYLFLYVSFSVSTVPCT